ncbi:hypothetical protein AB0I10_15300 [Streptomyces sp. NPDC050636]|uniref:DUF7848 domain-containing protein n=1 Tax=Streptomyces sp. NPDC050636 TaxID=3154510 RepID=UPI00343B59E8
MRARYRFAEWTLAADSEVSLRFVGECLDCGERCVDTASADEAQWWCLKHAGLTGDRRFEMKGFQFFTAYLTNAAADGAPPAT